MNRILGVILFLIPSIGLSTTKITTLKHKLDTSQYEIDKLSALCGLSFAYIYVDTDSAQFYIDEAIIKAEAIHADSIFPYTHNIQACVFYGRGLKEEALEWWEEALSLARFHKTKRTEIQILNNLAIWHKDDGNSSQSRKFLRMAFGESKALDNYEIETDLLVTLGNSYLAESILDSALEHFQQAAEICKTHSIGKNYALALNNIAVSYVYKDEFAQALDYYIRADSIAHLHQDVRLIRLTKINIADLYLNLSNIERAEQWIKKIEDSSGENIEYTSQIDLEVLKIRVKLLRENHKEVLSYTLNLLDNRNKISARHERLFYYYLLISSIKTENAELVIQLLPRAIELSDSSSSVENLRLSLLIGESYLTVNNFQKAEEYYNKVDRLLIDEMEDDDLDHYSLDAFSEGYHKLGTYHTKKGSYEKSAFYLQRAFFYQNQLYVKQLNREYQKGLIDFEVYKKEAELELLNEKNERTNLELEVAEKENLLLLNCSLLVVVILATGFRLRTVYLKRKQESLNAEMRELKLVSDNAKLQSEKLEEELKAQGKELLSQAMQIIQKNKLLSEHRSSLKQAIESNSQNELETLLQSLEKALRLKNKEWEVFTKSFESVNKDFFDNVLRDAPNLTPRELQLCALIRLNLSLKELSALLSISIDGVKKARHRIRKKLQLSDSKVSLTKFLMKY